MAGRGIDAEMGSVPSLGVSREMRLKRDASQFKHPPALVYILRPWCILASVYGGGNGAESGGWTPHREDTTPRTGCC